MAFTAETFAHNDTINAVTMKEHAIRRLNEPRLPERTTRQCQRYVHPPRVVCDMDGLKSKSITALVDQWDNF
ncbi:hypothetical protein PG997_011840 [Apiospora hydei]|uniref:Uncharacterized protein n=1 Tax=Apiospora hydei TaxID=1337664 RepID=A0ABR1V1R1_9PEZI